MDSIRINLNKCDRQSFLSFINNINNNGKFDFKAHNPADDTVMQDRYTYKKNGDRISIVYETKAQTLILTAPQRIMNELTALLPAEIANDDRIRAVSENKKTIEQQKVLDSEKNGKPFKKRKSENKLLASDQKAPIVSKTDKESVKSNSARQEMHSAAKTSIKNRSDNTVGDKRTFQKENIAKIAKPRSVDKSSNGKSDIGNKTKSSAQSKAQADGINQKDSKIQTTNTFTIKKVSSDKFNELLKKIKANKSMRYKLISSNDDVKVYAITSHGEKANVKFEGGNIQLGGTRGDLYSELQLMMSQVSDYKTAIKSHIKSTGEAKRASEIEKQLKKMLPAAYEFLSEHSKIDLAIGIYDINNSAVVLSDYSTLLIPCFRGLERLIFDLQHAQSIEVKMIGQAYEKEDGNYVLKSGYRRKIPSVIYAEVMAALYTEYFKHRNFYAHSDGGYDNISRIISDKSQVQTIFNHIMEVINYNGKKLKEIGFRIEK